MKNEALKVIAAAEDLWRAARFVGDNDGRKAALRAEWGAKTAVSTANIPGRCVRARGFLRKAKKDLKEARRRVPGP